MGLGFGDWLGDFFVPASSAKTLNARLAIPRLAMSMAYDLKELLTAKGFTIRGSFGSRDEMTYNDKVSSNFAIEINIDLNPQYRRKHTTSTNWGSLMNKNSSAVLYMMNGEIILGGNLANTATSPKYGEKLWKKNIPLKHLSFTYAGVVKWDQVSSIAYEFKQDNEVYIDPKPIFEMESMYSSMANNPISNIDILGDITHYYGSDGTLLKSYEDGHNYATITVIADDNLKAFTAWSGIMDQLQEFVKGTKAEISDETKSDFLRGFGVSYDTKEYFDYYEKHSEDYHDGSLYSPADGKGDLINEHMAGLELKKRYLRVKDKAEDAPGNNPTQSSTLESGESRIHTHTAEGRRAKYQGMEIEIQTGKAAFADDLKQRAFENPSAGIFKVAVSPTHVYLYKHGVVVIAVDRNGVPSKNSKEIE